METLLGLLFIIAVAYVIRKNKNTSKRSSNVNIVSRSLTKPSSINSLKNSRAQLRTYYELERYEVIPEIPSEQEAKRILGQKDSFPFAVVPKEYMNTLDGQGLLRGHIIIMWWLNNSRTNKNNVPQYFLYEYGFNFNKELKYLEDRGYIKNNKVTATGKKVLDQYNKIVDQHRAGKRMDSKGNIIYLYSKIAKIADKPKLIYEETIQMSVENIENYKKNGITEYEFIADSDNSRIKKLDGKIFKVSEAKIGVNFPPLEIEDKSYTAAYVDRKELDRMLSRYGK